jgi:hypothetical protein
LVLKNVNEVSVDAQLQCAAAAPPSKTEFRAPGAAFLVAEGGLLLGALRIEKKGSRRRTRKEEKKGWSDL